MKSISNSVCRSGVVFFCTISLSLFAFGQNDPEKNNGATVKIGAYYFDGWTGKYPQHITAMLKDSFSNRKPKWGWITSSQEILDQQILTASGNGIHFFSFCWYYSGKEKYKTEPLNNALKYFRNSRYTAKMKYCLMVANHKGFSIGKEDWDIVASEWIRQFKTANYLTVNHKPLLILFSVPSLVNDLGSITAVKTALQALRDKALDVGLPGITISACVSNDKKSINQAVSCGFDMLTGYNYHSSGFKPAEIQTPIDSMQSAEKRLWDRIATLSNLKYIPVATLNWDPRPWSNTVNGYDKAPYFVGYSEKSVYQSVSGLVGWLHKNADQTTQEKIGLLYAWNEYGEGAYLTPSKEGPNLLRGLQNALKNK